MYVPYPRSPSYLVSQKIWRLPGSWKALGFWTWLHCTQEARYHQSVLTANSQPATALSPSKQNWVANFQSAGLAWATRHSWLWAHSEHKAKGCMKSPTSSDYKQKLEGEMLLPTVLQGGALRIMPQPGHRVSKNALPSTMRLRTNYHASVEKNSPTFPKNK